MRIVPCRVVCYYKFNVKSGWQKMRVVEGGRLSIWNGSIHLPFLLVSKCVQRKGKARWGKLISKKRNHFIADHTVKHISPLGLVQAAYPKLLVILFYSSVKVWTSVDLHFCSWFLLKESWYILKAISTCFILYLWKTHGRVLRVFFFFSFHFSSVFFSCWYVSVSVKRATFEREHCSDLRCQWRRGHSQD